ncbi:MAG: glycosyltransferase family 39 protein [Bryobacteraceae bacterium]|nr:glycosyltransferase family 39 protein [Bryobacteraceae bacterium]
MREHELKPARGEVAGICAILAVFMAVLAALAFDTGVTVDEPAHLLSSYLYWQGKDTLQPGDMPTMIRLAGGWVPHLTGLRLPNKNHEVWKSNHEWNVSQEMMASMNAAEIARAFHWARLPMLVFPAGCCLLIWWWGRQLFSSAAGLLAALAWALCTLVLGHGALFKNDLMASFAYLLFWYKIWVFWRAPAARNAAWMGVAVLVAVMSKYSLLVFLPVAPAVVLLRTFTVRLPAKQAALMLALLVAIPYAGIQLTWLSPLKKISPQEVQAWAHAGEKPDWSVAAVRTMAALRMPPRFVRGVMSLVDVNAAGSAVYLLGKVYNAGHPAYFLIAMAVKLNLALLAVILAGTAGSALTLIRGKREWADLCWFAPAFLYIGLASLSNLQLGLRLILPGIAFLILMAGWWLDWAWRLRSGRVAVLLLFGWMAGRTALAYPHYISDFNLAAGGPDNGLAYLSDSNIDWGQDVARLAKIVRQQRIPRIRLAYFGLDNPYAYLSDPAMQTLAPPWSDDMVSSTRFVPEPGYYAISATLLTGQFFVEKYRDYYSCFRRMKPIAKAGYSIWIFLVPSAASSDSPEPPVDRSPDLRPASGPAFTMHLSIRAE